MLWNMDDTPDIQGWPGLVENYQIHHRSSDEWAGRGTIAHITRSTLKNFGSLPPEVHERLQKASLQLSVDNSISLRLRETDGSSTGSTESPISAVQQYERARFQLDCAPPLYPAPALAPEPSPYTKSDAARHGNSIGVSPREKYILHLTSQIPAWETPRDDLKAIERFRVQLNSVAQKAVLDYASQHKLVRPLSVSLQCFGGYRAGFALRNSDMDLIAVTDNLPYSMQRKLRYLLAQAFISVGFAAFLLPDTQGGSSVLRICQKPSQDCLDVIEWETPDTCTEKHLKLFTSSPLRCHTESSRGESGVHCNIYFDNTSLLLCKTDLLRCYRVCDDRVYEMALFIKQWARARKINDPYSGTLSSYGYILMLLHYLINVASPPVVPNLQGCDAGSKELQWVNGCEVFFWRNQREIAREAEKGNLTMNHQSTASLLRGFFHFYSGPRHGPQACHLFRHHFCWADEVVSIRGSRPLFKTVKDWTAFKKNPNGGGSYYMLAIEDPFEINQNVAKMIDGKSADLLKAEFQRANKLIKTAYPVPGTDLSWKDENGETCEDLFAERVAKA